MQPIICQPRDATCVLTGVLSKSAIFKCNLFLFFKQIWSSIRAKTETKMDPLCCDGTILSAEKSLYDTIKREDKIECSEINSEIKQEHETKGVLAYSEEHLENLKSSFQVGSWKFYY